LLRLTGHLTFWVALACLVIHRDIQNPAFGKVNHGCCKVSLSNRVSLLAYAADQLVEPEDTILSYDPQNKPNRKANMMGSASNYYFLAVEIDNR
jgi:hypothetical protein